MSKFELNGTKNPLRKLERRRSICVDTVISVLKLVMLIFLQESLHLIISVLQIKWTYRLMKSNKSFHELILTDQKKLQE